MKSTTEALQTSVQRKPTQRRLRGRQARDRWVFILLVVPAMFWFFALMIWPMVNMFYVSMFDWRGLIRPKQFIGLANYVRMLSDDPRFVRALINTGIHWLLGLPGAMFPAYMLGFFLSLRLPGNRIMRTVFFSPTMISAAGVALMFTGIFMPDGIINSLLRAAGLVELTRPWLADPETALATVIVTDVWDSIGFQSMLFFAVLSGVPREFYEAARIDGASYWVIMWRIAFPLVLDTFGVLMMLRTLWILLGSAQIVLLLTRGGPGNTSLTLGYYLYQQAFLTQRLGYSQTIATFTFVLGIIAIVLIRRSTRRSYQI